MWFKTKCVESDFPELRKQILFHFYFKCVKSESWMSALLRKRWINLLNLQPAADVIQLMTCKIAYYYWHNGHSIVADIHFDLHSLHVFFDCMHFTLLSMTNHIKQPLEMSIWNLNFMYSDNMRDYLTPGWMIVSDLLQTFVVIDANIRDES